jgi:hypothetical protein
MKEQRHYICAVCKRHFSYDIKHDEVAKAEFERNFPNHPKDAPIEIVCDSCYQKVRPQ